MDEQLQNQIPQELKALHQWVVWGYETRDGQKTKVPYMPDGQHAKSNDPSTWSDYQSCVDASSRFDGIGIMLANGLVGIDLDHHLDEQGRLSSDAKRIVDQLPTYWEISPSERGLHALGFGKLPNGRRKITQRHIEMYETGRFFTVTGNHLEGTPTMVARLGNELAELHQEIFHESNREERQLAAAPALPINLDDTDLIARAMHASNGAEFSRLLRGDTSAYGGDDSSADLALCNHLAFWTGKDAARMDRLFRTSGLMRDKWDERHSSDGRTYGQMTIDKAITDTAQVYGSQQGTRYASIAADKGDNSPDCTFLSVNKILECLQRQEAGDAELLAELYSGKIVYDRAEKQWYVWQV